MDHPKKSPTDPLGLMGLGRTSQCEPDNMLMMACADLRLRAVKSGQFQEPHERSCVIA